MRDDQIIIISTHQVKDIETLLDHITIIEPNNVLLNERVNMEEYTNLEELFIQTINKQK